MRSWGLPPDFLRSLVAPAHIMRLSLKKAAYAVASSAAYRKSGSPHRFRPRYAPRQAGAGLANLGHPSYSFRLCYDTDSAVPLRLLRRFCHERDLSADPVSNWNTAFRERRIVAISLKHINGIVHLCRENLSRWQRELDHDRKRFLSSFSGVLVLRFFHLCPIVW